MIYGSPTPLWPLPLEPKQWTAGGSFGAARPSSKNPDRTHQGIDLYAPQHTPVLACEDGVVVGDQGWDGPGTRAVMVESPTGIVILYGAVAPGSYPKIGQKLKRGDQVATVGVYPHGSTMLHIEFWAKGTKFKPSRPKWAWKGSKPPELYDGTEYLQRAMGNVQDGPSNKPAAKGYCGAEYVTASTDPLMDPLRGDLTFDHPCSVFDGLEVCTPINTTAWRATVKRELDALIPKYNQFNDGIGTKYSWDEETSLAYDQMLAAQKAYEDWNAVNSLPANAVDALRRAAADARCARRVFDEWLDIEILDDDEPVKKPSKPSNSKPNTPVASKGGGGGAAIAIGGLAAAAFILK